MAAANISAARLRELLNYDPDTGVFTWRFSRKGRKGVAGAEAGWSCPRGYRYITLDRIRHCAHRLAILYMSGILPKQEVDHINGNPADNSYANLRQASPSLNRQNLHKAKSQNQSGGLLGVSIQTAHGDRRYRARITLDGKEIRLGRYDTPEEAHEAYLEAKRRLHPGCTI